MTQARRIRSGTVASALVAVAALAVGCGGGTNFQAKPRPPATIQLTGVITDHGVIVSPNRVGAGPVQILVSNQTQEAHTLTLDGANIQPVRSRPIDPTDTGSITRSLTPGVYTVKAGTASAVKNQLAAARIVIGKARPDSNNQVGLP
jgi:hypothetical protein